MRILLWLWQFPQNVIGVVFAWLCSPQRHTFNLSDKRWREASLNYTEWMERGGYHYGITFGKYIFLYRPDPNGDLTNERHEYGHTVQSMILGPLYLFVIGIPSLIHAWWWDKGKGSYYNFFTEKWADKLGRVKRND